LDRIGWWGYSLKMNLDKLEEFENKLKNAQKEQQNEKSVVQKIKEKYPGHAGNILSEDFLIKTK